MKIKMYVDWQNEDILTESEYEAKIKTDALEMSEEDDAFEEFAEERYYYKELFELNEDERERVKEEFLEWCRSRTRANYDHDYTEIKKEF
jgi:hypothetical protein